MNDNGASGAHSYLLRTKKRQSETASVMCGHGFVNSGAWSQHAEAYVIDLLLGVSTRAIV